LLNRLSTNTPRGDFRDAIDKDTDDIPRSTMLSPAFV
jgi:hypothetical protein